MGTHDPLSQNNENFFAGNSENEGNNDDTQFERGNHPNSIANLQPFPKGVSGNPSGRPKNYEILKRVLNKYGDEVTHNWNEESNGTMREQVLKGIWEEAIRGDMKYVQLLAKLGCLDEDWLWKEDYNH